ncbi:MAG: vWA domain-containing protein, partial [Opitutales bacterium]
MLTFAQPWAFLALAAVALPILAHMAFRRTTKRHKFPSLRFIRASRIPRTGRKTPVDLLLLFLRILFFILLACLLADPRLVMPEESGEGQQTVLLLDQSASMGGWGAWTEAQAEVDRFLSEAKGDVGFLGFATEPLVQSEIAPTRDLDLIRQAVQDAKPTLARGNPQTAVDRALRVFRSGTQGKTLIVVTDLQRANWQAVAHKLGSEGVRLDLRVVGRSQAQGPNRPGNLTLSNARTAPAGLGKLRIWAQVRNSSANEVNASLVLELGGEAHEKTQVLVGPHSAAQTQFVVPRGDFATAVVRIVSSGEDAFLADDSRKLWLKAPPPRRFGFFSDSFDASLEERL